jgi:hypothetical protein
VIVLPPVDTYSQQTIRLSIVSEKITTWFDICFFLLLLLLINFVLNSFKQIFSDGSGQITINDLRSTLSELLLTFK